MRSIFLRRAALAVAAATVFCSAANAQLTRGNGGRPRCATSPSLAECQSASYLNACHVATECDAVVHAAAQSSGRGSFKMRVWSAAAWRPKGPALRPDGTIDPFAILTPYDLGPLQVTVPSLSFEGGELSAWLASEKTKPSLAAAAASKHPTWEADGPALNSCEEYVFQKFYDYVRFDEAAQSLGSDYWTVFDLAYAPAPLPGIANRTFREIDGQTAVDPQITFGTWGKNDFFNNGFSIFQDLDAVSGTGLGADIQAFLKAEGVFGVWSSAPPSSDFWSWNASMASQQRNAATGASLLTPVAYASMEQRQKHYSALATKIQVSAVSMAVLAAKYEDLLTPYPPCGKKDQPKCRIVNPDGSYGGNVMPDYSSVHLPYIVNPTSDDDAWIDAFAAKHPDLDTLVAKARASYISDAKGNDAYVSWRDDAIADSFGARVKYEYLLARFLEKEWSLPNHGCMTTTNNFCDWSPKKFAKKVTGAYSGRTGMTYRDCIAQTGNDFAAVRYTDTPDVHGRRKQDHFFPTHEPSYKADYGTSNTSLEAFFDLYRQRSALWKAYADEEKALVAQVSDLPFAPNNAVSIGESTSDAHAIGDPSSFGASYDFSAAWNVTSVASDSNNQTGEPRICRLNGSMTASLHASVQALGAPALKVVDGDFDSAATDVDTHLYTHFVIAEKQIYVPADVHGDAFAPFSTTAPIAAQEASATLADYWYLLLDVVPVHLQASVVETAGLDLRTSAFASGGCNASNVTFTLNNAMVPYAKIDLVASAAVDVLLADAGVRADLNLVTVSLPFTLGLQAVPNGNGVDVTFSKRLDFALDELGGNVELFADLNAGFKTYSTSKTLFSWDGFHQKHNLWAQAKTFPLNALSLRMYGGYLTSGTQ